MIPMIRSLHQFKALATLKPSAVQIPQAPMQVVEDVVPGKLHFLSSVQIAQGAKQLQPGKEPQEPGYMGHLFDS